MATPVEVHALIFQLEPSAGSLPTASRFVNHWPGYESKQAKLWNAHPDRDVMDTRAGDVLVHRDWQKRVTRSRVLRVRIFASSLCRSEQTHVWAASVAEAIERAHEIAPTEFNKPEFTLRQPNVNPTH